MLPFWYPKSTKIQKTSISRGIKKMIDFGIASFDHVGRVFDPKFRQLGRQWRHLGPRESPSWPPRGLWELDAHENVSWSLLKRPSRRPWCTMAPLAHGIALNNWTIWTIEPLKTFDPEPMVQWFHPTSTPRTSNIKIRVWSWPTCWLEVRCAWFFVVFFPLKYIVEGLLNSRQRVL